MNNLTFNLKEKEEQTESKVSRKIIIKIRVEINEIKNKKIMDHGN